jgi:hypothetical protein
MIDTAIKILFSFEINKNIGGLLNKYPVDTSLRDSVYRRVWVKYLIYKKI